MGVVPSGCRNVIVTVGASAATADPPCHRTAVWVDCVIVVAVVVDAVADQNGAVGGVPPPTVVIVLLPHMGTIADVAVLGGSAPRQTPPWSLRCGGCGGWCHQEDRQCLVATIGGRDILMVLGAGERCFAPSFAFNEINGLR